MEIEERFRINFRKLWALYDEAPAWRVGVVLQRMFEIDFPIRDAMCAFADECGLDQGALSPAARVGQRLNDVLINLVPGLIWGDGKPGCAKMQEKALVGMETGE